MSKIEILENKISTLEENVGRLERNEEKILAMIDAATNTLVAHNKIFDIMKRT